MILTAAILFILSFILGMHDSEIAYQYMFGINMISFMLILLHSYNSLDYHKVRTKILVALCFAMNSFMFLTYLQTLITEHITYIPLLVSFSIFVFLFFRNAYVSYVSDDYSNKGSYIVYKKPKNLYGILVSLFFRFSSVMIVINGTEYKFSNGKYIEKPHVYKSGLVYKSAEGLDVLRARLFLGRKWNLLFNCFTIKRVVSLGQRNRKSSKKAC